MAIKGKQLVGKPCDSVDTAVTVYDQFSAAVSAGVALFGAMASMLFVLWLGSLFYGEGRKIVVVLPETSLVGQSLNPEGFAKDIESPGEQENPEIQNPCLIDAVHEMDVLSTIQANHATTIGGDYVGLGDGDGGLRRHGDPRPLVDRQSLEHWQVRYSMDSLQSYARQLDSLGIELGAVHKTNRSIVYARQLASKLPQIRKGNRFSERRIFFAHRRRQLQLWDQRLLGKLSVDDWQNRIIVQFYRDQTVAELKKLEADRLETDGRKREDIKTTIFEVAGTPGSYRFALKDVLYRN